MELLLNKVSERQEYDREIAALLEDSAELSRESERLNEYPLQSVVQRAARLSHFYMLPARCAWTLLKARQT